MKKLEISNVSSIPAASTAKKNLSVASDGSGAGSRVRSRSGQKQIVINQRARSQSGTRSISKPAQNNRPNSYTAAAKILPGLQPVKPTARRNLNMDSDVNAATGFVGSSIRGPLLVHQPGQDQASRNKELELNLLRAAYLRSIFGRHVAEGNAAKLHYDISMQFDHLWECNKALDDQNTQMSMQVCEMKQSQIALQKYEQFVTLLKQYCDVAENDLSRHINKISDAVIEKSATIRLVNIPREYRDKLKGKTIMSNYFCCNKGFTSRST